MTAAIKRALTEAVIEPGYRWTDGRVRPPVGVEQKKREDTRERHYLPIICWAGLVSGSIGGSAATGRPSELERQVSIRLDREIHASKPQKKDFMARSESNWKSR